MPQFDYDTADDLLHNYPVDRERLTLFVYNAKTSCTRLAYAEESIKQHINHISRLETEVLVLEHKLRELQKYIAS
jgi:hypothetical protein